MRFRRLGLGTGTMVATALLAWACGNEDSSSSPDDGRAGVPVAPAAKRAAVAKARAATVQAVWVARTELLPQLRNASRIRISLTTYSA